MEIPAKMVRTKIKLIFTRAFSLTPHLMAVGDGSMLLVEGASRPSGNFRRAGLKVVGMQAAWNG